MPPSYSMFPDYAQAIAARDAILAGILLIALITFGNVALYSRYVPQLAYVVRLISVGGFYASMAAMAMAYHFIHEHAWNTHGRAAG